MQEPLLFNEPIKENIRYGNLTSTDAQVRMAAEQANCLSFIQSSQDQLCIPEVKAQIEKDFKTLLTNLISTDSAFSQLDTFVKQQALVIEEVFLLSELFTSINRAGTTLIASNLTEFLRQITDIVDKEGENLFEKTW
jgi:hypothetical protein